MNKGPSWVLWGTAQIVKPKERGGGCSLEVQASGLLIGLWARDGGSPSPVGSSASARWTVSELSSVVGQGLWGGTPRCPPRLWSQALSAERKQGLPLRDRQEPWNPAQKTSVPASAFACCVGNWQRTFVVVLTPCDPMDHSTPGLPVHHQLPEFTQTNVHWVSDAVQPSHPLSSHPLLLLPSVFPSIRVFPSESVLQVIWSKYWSFSKQRTKHSSEF